MTEDEARVTQCCGGEGCGYVNQSDSIRYCVASACMGWRWLPTLSLRWSGNTMVGQYPDAPPTEGFCGLAGKP